MSFTAKQARCHYENGNGIPLNIKDNIIEKIKDRSTDSTALYIYKYETTARGLVDKCRFDAVSKSCTYNTSRLSKSSLIF